MNCDRHYGIAGYSSVCSGHGTCINNQCICNNDWTSQGDFETQENYDCDMNIMTIKVISGFVFCLSIITFISLLRYIYNTPITATTKNNQFDPKKYIPYSRLVYAISCAILSCGKMLYPTKFIVGGQNFYVLATVSACFMFIALGTSASLTIISNSKFLAGYSKIMSENLRIKLLKDIEFVERLIIPSLLFWYSSIIFFFFSSIYPKFSDKFAIGALICINIATFGFVIVNSLTTNVVIKELTEYLNSITNSNENNEYNQNNPNNQINDPISINHANHENQRQHIIDITRRLKLFNKSFITTFVAASPVFIFAAWNYLRRKLSYVILTAQIITVLTNFLWTLVRVNNNETNIHNNNTNNNNHIQNFNLNSNVNTPSNAIIPSFRTRRIFPMSIKSFSKKNDSKV